MGYLLYREVKVWAPRTLTKGEKLAALVLADNADDRSRETRDSVVDPELMEEAMVPDERSMRRIIARLQEEAVIKNIVAGHNGRTAKFLILKLAPTGWLGATGYRKRSDVGGQESPAYDADVTEEGAENHPPTDDVAGCFSAGSRVKTTRPRPPTNQTTTSAPADPPASPATDGGGGGQQQDEQQAEAFLQSLPSPWGAGRKTARDLAPLLLERTVEQGWQLDDDLTRWLSRDLGPVRTTHASVLRARIDDLPKKPTTRTRDSPPTHGAAHCGDDDCNPVTRYRTTEDTDGHLVSAPCDTCHPDHQEAA